MDATKQTVLTDECQPFSKLFISCQSRECDLYDFFRHENHPFPAALSDGGNSMHVRNPSLQQFLRVTLHSLIMNHRLMSSSLIVPH